MSYIKQKIETLTYKDTGIKFTLDDDFIQTYADKPVDFGFNGVGFLAYMRTYSRVKEDGNKEQWFETCRRVVEGVYSIQKRHIMKYHLGWDEDKAQSSAQEMYHYMFEMKWLPPGRGIWAMGSPIIEEKGLFGALNNCAFVSTKNLKEDPTKPFAFLMDRSMLGVGVGFDTKGAGKVKIHKPSTDEKETTKNLEIMPTLQKYFQEVEERHVPFEDMVEYNEKEDRYQLTHEMNSKIMSINWDETGMLIRGEVYEIPDTREGWVNSVIRLLESYFEGKPEPIFRYARIRPRGTEIKTFGGTASGPAPLALLHRRIRDLFEGREGEDITSTDIVDLFNMIGACVVAGNVRRSAEIAFGDPDDEEYLKLKDYTWNPETMTYEGSKADRAAWGWCSNNSIFAELGMDYSEHGKQTALNGEPGYLWLQNAQEYGRMGDSKDYKDVRAEGANPCVEQTLESYELCCLVENFPTRIKDLNEFKRVLKFSYLYAKTVTLGNTQWIETNRVMMRNRRIGSSISGIAQFLDTRGIGELKQWCEEGYETIQYYDQVYAEWLAVPRSIKTTSVKPSGTVSLLPGVSPGVHFPEDNYYIRRVTLSKDSPLVQSCKDAGFNVEDAVDDSSAVKVEIPVYMDGVRTVDEVSMWEQLEIAAFIQQYWADNQVSCTVTFQKHEADDIPKALDYFQYRLKGISFLPKLDAGQYAQAPYEAISKEKYEELIADVDTIKFYGEAEDAMAEKFCDTDSCQI